MSTQTSNTPPSADNIKLGKFVAGALGFEPHVYPYFDKTEENKLSVLSLADPIDQNVKIYCTIGVSDHPNIINATNIPIELLLATYKKYDKAPNILSTCGFYISKDGFECRPGTVFMRMVELYYKDTEMKHIYFTEPFLWQEKLEQLTLENKKVTFLFCIPISDKELQYKQENGDDALESLLQEHEIDFYDINRKSVI
jgi:hypothetical protein